MFHPPITLSSFDAEVNRFSSWGFAPGLFDPIKSIYYWSCTQFGAKNPVERGVISLLQCLITPSRVRVFLTLQTFLNSLRITARDEDQGDNKLSFYHFASMYQNAPEPMYNLLTLVGAYCAFFRDDATAATAINAVFVLDHHFPFCQFDWPYNQSRMAQTLVQRTGGYLNAVTKAKDLLAENLHDPFTLAPTSGDLHWCYASPLVVSYRQQAWYYKPHCMLTDLYLMEAISVFNEGVHNQLKLPSLAVIVLGGNNPKQSGLLAAAPHSTVMTRDEALTYSLKLGALLCFCKLFGCTDLHRENIMASTDGPYLIDCECSFLRNVIRSRNLIGSTLFNFLDEGTALKENCNFSVDGKNFCATAKTDQNFMTAINTGFAAAVTACAANQKLAPFFLRVMQENFYSRFVPIMTQDFMGYLYSYLRQQSFDASAIFSNIGKNVVNWLTRCSYLTAGNRNTLDFNELVWQLTADFNMGEIPIFQINDRTLNTPHTHIYIDGVSVLTLPPPTSAEILQEFTDNLTWMQSLGPIY